MNTINLQREFIECRVKLETSFDPQLKQSMKRKVIAKIQGWKDDEPSPTLIAIYDSLILQFEKDPIGGLAGLMVFHKNHQ